MAQRLIVTCDHCKTEASDVREHAHAFGAILPEGWSEIEVSTAKRDVPVPMAIPPDIPERIARQIMSAPLPLRATKTRATLCSNCCESLVLLIGDRRLELEEDASYGTIVGSTPRAF